MHKLDLWLLNKLDAFTIKLQRKGYRLTEFYVYVVGTTLISTLLDISMMQAPPTWLFVFCGTIWGGWLWRSIQWANTNKDYPESHKLMEGLNARALFERENMFVFRSFYGSMMTAFAVLEIARFMTGTHGFVYIIVSLISTLVPVLMFYLQGCFYIGPGHFAKDRQEQLQGNEVLDR